MHRTSRETRNARLEVQDRTFRKPKVIEESAKSFFNRPAYYGTALCPALKNTNND